VDREIAARLGTSVHTVGSQIVSARTKLDLGSRVELAAWAARRAGSGDQQA
jgi:DNA-binding CsgD family transcriptional regulator